MDQLGDDLRLAGRRNPKGRRVTLHRGHPTITIMLV